MPIEITCRDTDSGESQTRTITDDVVVIVAGRHYVANHQHWSQSGTHTFTIKVDRSPNDGQGAPRQRVALLHMLLDGKKVGDLTPADLRSHAGGVLNALAAADLDAGVHRALVKYGLEDHYARAMIDDLGKHWPAPTVPRGGA